LNKEREEKLTVGGEQVHTSMTFVRHTAATRTKHLQQWFHAVRQTAAPHRHACGIFAIEGSKIPKSPNHDL